MLERLLSKPIDVVHFIADSKEGIHDDYIEKRITTHDFVIFCVIRGEYGPDEYFEEFIDTDYLKDHYNMRTLAEIIERKCVFGKLYWKYLLINECLQQSDVSRLIVMMMKLCIFDKPHKIFINHIY